MHTSYKNLSPETARAHRYLALHPGDILADACLARRRVPR